MRGRANCYNGDSQRRSERPNFESLLIASYPRNVYNTLNTLHESFRRRPLPPHFIGLGGGLAQLVATLVRSVTLRRARLVLGWVTVWESTLGAGNLS